MADGFAPAISLFFVADVYNSLARGLGAILLDLLCSLLFGIISSCKNEYLYTKWYEDYY
jgi:hypothetical protein